MWSFLRAGSLGLVLASGIVMSAGAQQHPAAGLPLPRTSLSDAEQARAVQAASPQGPIASPSQLHPDSSRASGTDRVVVSRVQSVGADKTDQRLAVVTLYEYESNTTVNRLVDVNSGAVIEEDRQQGSGAPVATVEGQYAESLLRADARVRKLLEPFQGNATFSLLLTTTEDRSSPLYGKRVLSAIISTPEGFLTGGPRISVNLTDAAVIVQPR
ncbi:MAG: hypothetical protein ACRECO_00240 [Xanthobacteraceae bacterium]